MGVRLNFVVIQLFKEVKEMTQTQLLAKQVVESGKVKEVKAHLERKLKPVSVRSQFDVMFKK